MITHNFRRVPQTNRQNIWIYVALYMNVQITFFALFCESDGANLTAILNLTCAETLSTQLVSQTMKCLCPFNFNDSLDCEMFTCFINHTRKGVSWSRALEFKVVNYSPLRNTSEGRNISICLGMDAWKEKSSAPNVSYSLMFSHEMSVGVLQINDTCWEKSGLNCPFDLKLRHDLISLAPFVSSPNDPLFWNFTSPIFHQNMNWLTGLHAEGSVNNHYPGVLPGLAGTSIRTLSIIGSFGRDDNGRIPRVNFLPKLDSLSLQDDELNDLTENDLNGTENLINLQIKGKLILALPTGLRRLRKLQKLILQSTADNFTFIPDIFSDLLNLIKMDFSGTRIENWPQVFPSLPQLSVLYLIDCKMKSFSTSKSKFYGLANLYISKNNLKHLAPDALKGVPNITSLYADDNLIESIHPNLLLNLKNLDYLDLSGNKLIKWPILPDNYMSLINLSKNRLTTIDNKGRDGVLALFIDLSMNCISHWNDTKVFWEKKLHPNRTDVNVSLLSKYGSSSNTQLEVDFLNHAQHFVTPPMAWVAQVNLSYNLISEISPVMMNSFNVLKILDLGGNKINCNCQAKLFQKWLDKGAVAVYNLREPGKLECNQPPTLFGHQILAVNFDDICNTPRQRIWLGLGISLLGLVGAITIFGSLSFYYRTEMAYLLHLAKVRQNSKKINQDHADCIYDAFVCYSGRNRKWVMRRLRRLLERPPEHYKLCLFDRDFRLGTHIVSNIVDAIDSSRKVLVILTKHFIESKWCQWELEMANHKLFSEDRSFLVLLELEALERRRLPRLLRFLLDTRPVVRWPRPETTPSVLAAAAELRRALGPSLRGTAALAPQEQDLALSDDAAIPAPSFADRTSFPQNQEDSFTSISDRAALLV